MAFNKIDPKRIFGIVLFILALMVLIFGYISQYGYQVSISELLKDFYANVSTEFVSIAVTILIIDYLSERRADKNLMQQLAREMGSKDNAFAIKAVKELRAHGWLIDGSLIGLDFGAADLSSSDLSNANLSKTTLTATNLNKAFLVRSTLSDATINGANLEDADLSNSNLSGSDLRWSDLSNADLRGADINNANMEGVALDGAKVSLEQLRCARSLAQATMPDGRRYEEWVESNQV